jgi:hypothetical protein
VKILIVISDDLNAQEQVSISSQLLFAAGEAPDAVTPALRLGRLVQAALSEVLDRPVGFIPAKTQTITH